MTGGIARREEDWLVQLLRQRYRLGRELLPLIMSFQGEATRQDISQRLDYLCAAADKVIYSAPVRFLEVPRRSTSCRDLEAKVVVESCEQVSVYCD